MDNNDDDGENRDGDEQWYQYRTQNFCANSAYTLYGIPKHGVSILNHCSRGHYINSFFTYGGADVLLQAIGKSPDVYYDASSGYSNQNAYGYGNYTNADCTVLEYGDGNNGNDHRELEGEEPEQSERELNSGDNNYYNRDDDGYYGMSSTMGCSLNGKFNIATFGGEVCDGNNFIEVIDKMRKYNRQMGSVGCHQIHGNGILGGSNKTAVALLRNSWACDIDLYPDGLCPDPYGYKQRSANSLRAVSHGQSGRLAIMNGRLKMPLSIISWFAFLVGSFLGIFSYRLQNKERIERKGKGKAHIGMIRCLQTDFAVWIGLKRRKGSSKKIKGDKTWDSNDPGNKRSSSSKRRGSRSRSRSRNRSYEEPMPGDETGDFYDSMDYDDYDDHDDVEATSPRSSSKHKKSRRSGEKKKKKSKRSSKSRRHRDHDDVGL